MSLASRQLAEFNTYEAMGLVDSLKNAAHDTKHEKEVYFRLVYKTLRGKLHQSNDQFCNFILPLLGDSEGIANSHLKSTGLKMTRGETLGDVGDLLFRDPKHFKVGKLHEHVDCWQD